MSQKVKFRLWISVPRGICVPLPLELRPCLLEHAELTKTPQDLSKLDNHLDKNLKKKGMNRTFDSPFLLRQGEPGTSQ